MSLKTQIEVLDLAIKKLEENILDIQTQSSILSVERNKLLIQRIEKEYILRDTEWVLNSQGSNVEATNEAVLTIKERLNLSDYYFLEFKEGVHLTVSTGSNGTYAYIDYAEPHQIMSFAKRHKLIINGNAIAGKLGTLKRQVAALEILSHQYNLGKK